ncbi:MAG: heparinase II/III family protein [Myxococcota bacterium]
MSGLRLFPTLLRTVSHLQPRQLRAQITHMLRGYSRPSSDTGLAELSLGPLPRPFLEAPAHARWHEGDVLELIQTRVDFSSGMDWSHAASGPLWAYHLHNCDHLRERSLSPERRTELILDWIRNHETGVGWDPHPISLRLVSWGKLLLMPDALSLDEMKFNRISMSMANQADTLQANLEFRLLANHLLSNLVGLVFAGLLFSGPRADRWLANGSALIREMDLQFNDDGGHEERSPMYHSLLLESLLDLLNLARVRPERSSAELVQGLESVCSRGLGALALYCHRDGDIALFSDSAFDIAPRFQSLVEYAHGLGVAPHALLSPGLLGSTGYARLESDEFVLIASVAGPSPEHQPGHAHCDALAFELSCGEERVVTGMGVHEYVVGERRGLARATLSHATVEIDGAEQSEIWSAHRVGGRPRVVLEDHRPGHRVEASCAGWLTPDSIHCRTFILDNDGLEIRDRLEGQSRPVRLSLPLHPGIQARLVHDQDGGAEAHLVLPSGRRMRLVLPIEAEWRIESHPYFPRFGQEIQRERILGEAAAFESGTWRFEWLD